MVERKPTNKSKNYKLPLWIVLINVLHIKKREKGNLKMAAKKIGTSVDHYAQNYPQRFELRIRDSN